MFIRFIAQSIRRNPRRKALTVAAMAMGSAVATAMLGSMLQIGDRVNRELRSLGANLIVTPKSGSLPVEIGGISYKPISRDEFIPEDQISKINSIFWRLNITGVSPLLKAPARIGMVEGVRFDQIRAMNPAWQVDGHWPADGECLVGRALARRAGVGSTLDLFGRSFRVAGLLSTGGDEEDRVLLPLKTLQRLVHREGQVDAIEVSALTKPEDAFARKDPARMTPAEFERWNCTPYVSSIAHQIEEALPMTVVRPIRRVADNEGRVLSKIRGLMLLVSFAAMLAAALTVWSAMGATVLERRGEIAIMQAAGAGRWIITALLGVEVALQGLAGGAIGAALGWRLAGWVSESVFRVPPDVPGALIPLVILAAILVALAGAAQPLRRSLSLEPAIMLREAV